MYDRLLIADAADYDVERNVVEKIDKTESGSREKFRYDSSENSEIIIQFTLAV